MKTAVIIVLAGIGFVGPLAAAEPASTLSSTPRDGFYRSENGYVPAFPGQTERRFAGRALVPDVARPMTQRRDEAVIVQRRDDERRPAPRRLWDGRR